MAVDVAKGAYGTATDTIGANLATQQALASGITETGQALGSGLSGYGTAMAGFNGMNGTRFGSMAAAQKAAPYAGSISNVYGMGYVPRASAV